MWFYTLWLQFGYAGVYLLYWLPDVALLFEMWVNGFNSHTSTEWYTGFGLFTLEGLASALLAVLAIPLLKADYVARFETIDTEEPEPSETGTDYGVEEFLL